MKPSLLLFIFAILVGTTACAKTVVMDNDPELSIGLESVYFYKKQKFSGILKAVHPNGTVRLTEFKEGWEDGRAIDTFPNGNLAAEYFYRQGKFRGIHKAWYETGKARFRFEYNEKGEANGEHWEWYPEGNVYRYSRYEDGNLVGTKIWRKDGKVFANYTYTKERLYGVVGAKLCFKLKGDESNQKTVVNP